MGNYEGRFRGAFFHEIVDFLTKSSLGFKKMVLPRSVTGI